MKTLLTACIVSLSLAACASTSLTPMAAVDAASTTFTGYVRFTEGEFQLYEREAQVQAPFARPCVSGALPRDAQRSAAEMSGQKVTFTGRAVEWPAGEVGMEHEGSTIRNTCGVDHVILAQTVSVIR